MSKQEAMPELPAWKVGNEFAPYHAQASHVPPDHRDGWNACYAAATAALSAERAELRFALEQNQAKDARIIELLQAQLDGLAEVERLTQRVADVEQASKEGWRHADELDQARKEAEAEVERLKQQLVESQYQTVNVGNQMIRQLDRAEAAEAALQEALAEKQWVVDRNVEGLARIAELLGERKEERERVQGMESLLAEAHKELLLHDAEYRRETPPDLLARIAAAKKDTSHDA